MPGYGADSGKRDVVTEEDCRDAAAGGLGTAAVFNIKENVPDWPPGCYIYTASNFVYWNAHPTGAPHANAYPLCGYLI